MTRTRLVINGGHGRMGSMAAQGLANHDDIDLIACLGREDNLAQALTELKPDVSLELTQADCVYDNALTTIKAGIRPVIGASGLSKTEMVELKKLSDQQSLGGMIVPNFSLAAALMMHCSAWIGQYLPDVDITERHHAQKLDAPSATALHTRDMIEQARAQRSPQLASSQSAIPIHSQRMQGSLAHQSVIFGSPFESLMIHHDSLDRRCFLPGIIMSISAVMRQNTLMIGLESLLSHEGFMTTVHRPKTSSDA